MNDQMGNWLRRGGIALGIFVVGALIGWMARGASSHIAVSQMYVYQDWRLVCPEDKETKRTCGLGSVSIDPQSGQRVAELSIGYEQGNLDKRTLAITVPVGVLIPPGVGLQLGTDTKTYPYSTCYPNGCLAAVNLDDKLFDAMNAAPSINLVIADARGRSFSLPISLKGFKEARDAMNSTEAKRHSWWRRLWS